MFRKEFAFLFLFAFAGCFEPEKPPAKKPVLKPDTLPVQMDTAQSDTVSIRQEMTRPYSELENKIAAYGLTDISKLDSTIVIELRYSTVNNFLGRDMYGDFDRCFLQPDVAAKLVIAQAELRKKYPYYSLIVYDAVRPLHIQRMMWDTLHLPPGEKQKYLSNPDNGSLHNYGAAVDVSIVDEKGIVLDMGTPYDFFGEKAHPVKEQFYLESGELTDRQIFNREILRGVMRKGGFFGIQTEWWHFNSCTRAVAAEKYVIVE